MYLFSKPRLTNSDNSVLFLNTIKLESKWTKVFKIFPLLSLNFCENKTSTIGNNLPLFKKYFSILVRYGMIFFQNPVHLSKKKQNKTKKQSVLIFIFSALASQNYERYHF